MEWSHRFSCFGGGDPPEYVLKLTTKWCILRAFYRKNVYIE